MFGSDVLLTVAEVAVAFAGFASLVGILGHRESADDPRVLGVRMRAMLLSSLLVVGFSILPIVLWEYGLSPDLVWMASSVALVPAAGLYLRWLYLSIGALGRAGLTPTRFQRRVIIPTFLVSLVALEGLLLVNALLAAPAVYLTGLSLLLFQSGFAFCLIVFSFLPRIHQDRE